MRDYRRVGRSSAARLTPYAQAAHAAALERARTFAALRAKGKSFDHIGAEFGITGAAVYCALRRQGLLK